MAKEGNTKASLRGMLPQDLEPIMLSMGQPKFRAKQVLEWVYAKAADSYGQMSNIPAELREKLEQVAPLSQAEVLSVRRASDIA